MDELSNELQKLKIDKSKRTVNSGPRSGWKYVVVAIVLLAIVVAASQFYSRANASLAVDVVHPHVESPADSAVLVATGYVIAHHKIQVGSKIMGRVAWIGVEKGDKVQKDQIVVRLEDREYRAQYEQARAEFDAVRARLAEVERGSRPEEVDRARAEVERARAQLRTDEANLKRTENLVREGVSPAQTLDDARGRYDTSRAALDSATKTYELVRQGARIEQVDGARS